MIIFILMYICLKCLCTFTLKQIYIYAFSQGYKTYMYIEHSYYKMPFSTLPRLKMKCHKLCREKIFFINEQNAFLMINQHVNVGGRVLSKIQSSLNQALFFLFVFCLFFFLIHLFVLSIHVNNWLPSFITLCLKLECLL